MYRGGDILRSMKIRIALLLALTAFLLPAQEADRKLYVVTFVDVYPNFSADAAKILETQPAAIQLRYLQTLTEIGVEKNTTVVFPLPIDIVNAWMKSLAAPK